MATPEHELERWLHHYAPPDQPLGGVREMLVGLYEQEVPDLERARLARHTPNISAADIAEEMVVAFGTGWRRYPRGKDECVELWGPAREQLTQRVHGWMVATAAWLHFGIQLHGYAFVAPFPSWDEEDSRGEAQIIALELCRGKCQCWRLHLPDGSQRYVEAKYWRCQTCKSYYAEGHAVCPKCGHPRRRGVARSTVWERGDLFAGMDIQERQEPEDDEEAIHDAIAQLPPELKNIVRMLLNGMSPKEIARRLQCPLHQIDTAIDAVRQLLTS